MMILITIRNSNSLNKREDNNILYLLMNLNLGDLYNIFMSNCISFNDIFLLTKEDFIEMKIHIFFQNTKNLEKLLTSRNCLPF